MNKDEILKMEAGREMDALVAEYVMGLCAHVWQLKRETDPVFCDKCDSQIGGWDYDDYPTKECKKCGKEVRGLAYSITGEPVSKPYSTHIAPAWEVVEKVDWGGEFMLACDRDGEWLVGICKNNFIWEMQEIFCSENDTASVAICRAALLVVMSKE